MKKFLNIDKHQVEINIFGNMQKVLILLPGWTHDFQFEKNFIQELSKKRRMITISYPGYTASEENKKAQSMIYLSGLIDSTVEALKINTFMLVGFSMGCQVATYYLKSHSKQKAVLISPVMHSLLDDTPLYGKIILKSQFLIDSIRNLSPIKKLLVDIACSNIMQVTEGKNAKSSFESSYVTLNGAYDTLIATAKYFIDPVTYKNRVKFVFGEHEIGRKVLDKKEIKCYLVKNSGHGSFDKNYKQIANFILK